MLKSGSDWSWVAGIALAVIALVYEVFRLAKHRKSGGCTHDWETVDWKTSEEIDRDAQRAVDAENGDANDKWWSRPRLACGVRSAAYENSVCLKCGAVSMQIDRELERAKAIHRDKRHRKELARKLVGMHDAAKNGIVASEVSRGDK